MPATLFGLLALLALLAVSSSSSGGGGGQLDLGQLDKDSIWVVSPTEAEAVAMVIGRPSAYPQPNIPSASHCKSGTDPTCQYVGTFLQGQVQSDLEQDWYKVLGAPPIILPSPPSKVRVHRGLRAARFRRFVVVSVLRCKHRNQFERNVAPVLAKKLLVWSEVIKLCCVKRVKWLLLPSAAYVWCINGCCYRQRRTFGV